MNWKAFGGFVALILIFTAAVGVLMLMRRPGEMTFFFTADTQGLLVPCGCKVVPAGGLARRAAVLDLLRKRSAGEAVVPIELTHAFADRGPGRALLNAEMGRFLAREGYLVGLGSYDLLLGLGALREEAPEVSLFLAGHPGLPGSREFRLGGWGAGPFGDGGSRLRVAFLAETAPEGVSLPDPVKAFAAEKTAHPADGWIAVGQLDPKTVSALLKANPDLIAVVSQWQTDVTTMPQEAGGQWVLYLGDRGRRAATLRVTRIGARWAVLPAIFYLGPDTPSSPAVEKEVAGVLSEVDAVNGKALAAAAKPAEAGRGYVGAAACQACHAEAHKAWAASPHARATTDLAIDHQERNPDCLRCHATGMGQPGGFPQKAVDLSGVQCEGCHGPGEGHPPRKLDDRPPGVETCGGCHTKRDSPMFDAAGFWQLVKHR